MRFVTIFFDLEGRYGCPLIYDARFEEIVHKILRVLDRYGVKAVFNTCGKLAEDFPTLMKEIYSREHELASHGYEHEDFLDRSVSELKSILSKTEDALKEIVGTKPVGIRSPGLQMNLFSPVRRSLKEGFYCLLKKRNYQWSSNCCLWPFFRPEYSHIKVMLKTCSLSILRNFPYLGARPFKIGGLLEVPILSPLELTMLDLPKTVAMDTHNVDLKKASEILKAYFINSGRCLNLNFHEWMIGSAGRIKLLNHILEFISKNDNVTFVTTHELASDVGFKNL